MPWWKPWVHYNFHYVYVGIELSTLNVEWILYCVLRLQYCTILDHRCDNGQCYMMDTSNDDAFAERENKNLSKHQLSVAEIRIVPPLAPRPELSSPRLDGSSMHIRLHWTVSQIRLPKRMHAHPMNLMWMRVVTLNKHSQRMQCIRAVRRSYQNSGKWWKWSRESVTFSFKASEDFWTL